MVSRFYGERDRRWIFRARLALALAGRRAEKCPNRSCARLRHCMALAHGRSGEGGCPMMTDAEREAADLAIACIGEALRPWFRAQDAREEALVKSLTKAKRRDAGRPRWKPYYFDILWTEPVGDRLDVPKDIAAKEKTLIAAALAAGCSCASRGIDMGCTECPAVC